MRLDTRLIPSRTTGSHPALEPPTILIQWPTAPESSGLTQPGHTYQVLTKRSERLARMLAGPLRHVASEPHIWWGVSVENRKHGLPRIEHLQRFWRLSQNRSEVPKNLASRRAVSTVMPRFP